MPARAVEALIFDRLRRLLLHRRGQSAADAVGMLEGIGGAVRPKEGLRCALRRELCEEIGAQCIVHVAGRLFRKKGISDRDGAIWTIDSYVCALISGDPIVAEPEKNDGFIRVTIGEAFDRQDLSSSTRISLRALARKQANLDQLLRPFFGEPGAAASSQ